MRSIGIAISLTLLGLTTLAVSQPAVAQPAPVTFHQPAKRLLQPGDVVTTYLYLPLVTTSPDPCSIPTGEIYGALSPIDPMPTGVAAVHGDINLALRGYELNPSAYLGMVFYDGGIDTAAPQLKTLFDDQRVPVFSNGYQVYKWDWVNNRRGELNTGKDVTLLGMQTTPGELIRLPVAGYDVGEGYGALVLYAETTRLTLKYTREDNVVGGYTIHLEDLCVDPNLLADYQNDEAAGRQVLPALYPGQPLGRASGAEVGAAIRDQGKFLDPRSCKDWWQGHCP
ncbi:MAG TPA: hypothetical protein VII92_16925 [Anaerolineae bacterium]